MTGKQLCISYKTAWSETCQSSVNLVI